MADGVLVVYIRSVSATGSSYTDGKQRAVGPKGGGAAAAMLTDRSERPTSQPLPCLRPVFSAAILRQMSVSQRRAAPERRRMLIFKPVLS